MSERTVPVKDEHKAYFNALVAAIGNEGGDIPCEELLAITAKVCGRLLALMDQRRYSPATAMEIVARNIEVGNAEVLNDLRKTTAAYKPS